MPVCRLSRHRLVVSVVLLWESKKSARSGHLDEVVGLVPHKVVRIGRDGSASKCAATRGVKERQSLLDNCKQGNIQNSDIHLRHRSAPGCCGMDTLECWVYDDDSYSIFPVEISRTKTVGALKKVIKDENPVSFNSVDARHLILYSIPMPDDEHFAATLKRWTFKGQTRLNDRHTLSVLNTSDSLIIVYAPNLGTLIVVSSYPSDE